MLPIFQNSATATIFVQPLAIYCLTYKNLFFFFLVLCLCLFLSKFVCYFLKFHDLTWSRLVHVHIVDVYYNVFFILFIYLFILDLHRLFVKLLAHGGQMVCKDRKQCLLVLLLCNSVYVFML